MKGAPRAGRPVPLVPAASRQQTPPRHALASALATRFAVEELAEGGKLELARSVCAIGMPVVFDALISAPFFTALAVALRQEPFQDFDYSIGETPRRVVRFEYLELVIDVEFIESGDSWQGGMPAGLRLHIKTEEGEQFPFIHSAQETPTQELEEDYLPLTSANGHPDLIRRLAFRGWQEFPELANVVLNEELVSRRDERDAAYPYGTITPFSRPGAVGVEIAL